MIMHAMPRSYRIRATLLLLAFAPCGSALATPQYLIVGDTQGGASHCEYTTIQAALDAGLANGPDLDYVFVTNTASYAGSALVVGDQSVLIEGGYDDCDLSIIGPRAAILGDQVHSVIYIQTDGSTGARDITLRHLDVSLGDAEFGGGVFVYGNNTAPPYVLFEDVLIHDNSASYGGGLASVVATLAIGKDVSVLDNTARRLGGGMYLGGGTVHIENDRTSISGNHAEYDMNLFPSGRGGGIYGEGAVGAPLDVSIGPWQYEPGSPRPSITGLLVSANRADDRGGGLYLNNSGAKVVAFETILQGNSAAQAGGGALIYGGATLQMSRDFPGAPAAPQCADYLQCNVIRGNSVDAHSSYATSGGGIFVFVGTLRLNQTALLENIADAGSAISTGSIVGAPNPPNTLRLQGVLASRNDCVHTYAGEGCSTVNMAAGADARISYTTIADNVHSPGSLANEIVGYAAASSSLKLFSSIIVAGIGAGAVSSGGGATYETDCVISSSNVLPPGTNNKIGFSPGFNNPSAYDYRLRSESLATDYCSNTNTSSDDFTDLNLYPRGFDDLRHANLHGAFDVGAFESDHVFGGGYE
jgi:hypothetical protein